MSKYTYFNGKNAVTQWLIEKKIVIEIRTQQGNTCISRPIIFFATEIQKSE